MSWFNRNYHGIEADVADSLSGDASGSLFSRIFGGSLVPLAVAWYGLYVCLTKKAYLHGSGHSLEINGSLAICFGIAVIALAFFLHFHFVWSVSSRLYRYAGFCKFIALLVLISSFGYVLWRIIFFGIA